MTDFLIIGGGIAGASAAAAVKNSAPSERQRRNPPSPTTPGRSAALYEPRYGAPAVVERRRHPKPISGAGPTSCLRRGLMIVAKADQTDLFRPKCATCR